MGIPVADTIQQRRAAQCSDKETILRAEIIDLTRYVQEPDTPSDLKAKAQNLIAEYQQQVAELAVKSL